MYRRRRPRPLLFLQWFIVALIVMVIFKSLGLPWFFWFFPFIFVFSWGGCGGGKRRWKHHRRQRYHRRRKHDDDYDDDDEDYQK